MNFLLSTLRKTKETKTLEDKHLYYFRVESLSLSPFTLWGKDASEEKSWTH